MIIWLLKPDWNLNFQAWLAAAELLELSPKCFSKVSAVVPGTVRKKLLLLGGKIFVNSLNSSSWLCLGLLPFHVSPQGPSVLGTEVLEACGEK